MSALSDPLSFVRGSPMRNRVVLAPLTNEQSHPDGSLSEDEYRWLAMRATGGFGLIMTCAAHMQQSGQGWKGQLGIFDDRHLEGLERLADTIAAGGSLGAVQLHHAGRRSSPEFSGMGALAPWDDEETGARAMTTGEIEGAIEDFGLAAARAEAAGFDGAELHGAHGYLIAQFLDGKLNQREDGYGGTFDGRARFVREAIGEVRRCTSPDFQLGLRLSPERYHVSLEGARQLAREMMLSGAIDYLDMSLWDVFKLPNEDEALPEVRRGKPLISHFTELPRGNTRLGVAGKIMSSHDAQACLDLGADFVLIGKGAVLHHDFARRALADPNFRALSGPVRAEYLRSEGLSPSFIRYMGTWLEILDIDAIAN